LFIGCFDPTTVCEILIMFFFFFFFLQWANLIGPLQKNLKLLEAAQNRRFYGKMECLPLWLTSMGEKGRTLGITYGIKARCYWEHPWRTYWEPDGNPLGTWREHVGNKGKMRKKSTHSEVMLSLHVDTHEISISKTVCHHFWAGLILPL